MYVGQLATYMNIYIYTGICSRLAAILAAMLDSGGHYVYYINLNCRNEFPIHENMLVDNSYIYVG